MRKEFVNLVEESNLNLLEEAADLFLQKLKETNDLQKCISTFQTIEEGLGSAVEQYIVNNLKKIIAFIVDRFESQSEELSPAEKQLALDMKKYIMTLKKNEPEYLKKKKPEDFINTAISQGIRKPTGISIK